MKKRIISALLAVCLLVSLGTVGVFADGSVDDETPVESAGAVLYDGKSFATVADAVAEIHKLTGSDRMKEHVIQLTDDVTCGGFAAGYATISNGTTDGNSPVNITVQLNGHTYTVTNPTVGSSGTETNGFQLLKDSKVTFENGKIVSSLGNLLFQNYCDLTFENVDITATSASYVVSNNCGEMNLLGDSSITAGSGKNAFDVCWWPAGYPEGVDVTIDTTGTITGNIELGTYGDVSGKPTASNTLTIRNVELNGEIVPTEVMESQAKDIVTITGGSFSNPESIKEYLAPGLDVDDSGDVVVGSDAVAQVGDTVYTNLQDAINAAQGTSNAVEILKNFTITVPNGTAVKTGAVNINGNVTIDGNHKTITAGEGFIIKDGTGLYHVINIQGNATVTIKNLSINGANMARSGINVFGDATSAPVVTLTDVDVKNCTTYGVTNGSAKVTASDLTTNGNRWGGVNVDSKNADATFKMTSGTLADNYSVVVGESASNKSVVNLDGGTYNTVQVKVSNTDVNISRGTYGRIELTSGVNKGAVDVTGGTFKTSVSEYVDSSMPYEAKTSSGLYTYHRTPESAADAAGQGGYVNYILGGVTHDVTLYYDKYVQTEIEVPHNYDFELPGGKFGGKEIIGWTLGGVTYKDGDEVEIDRNMTFYVVLKDGEFDIVIDSKIEHGDISTNVNSADKGDTVYIYVDPDTGYVLDDIDVYYGFNYRYSVKVSYVRNNTYRFEMPNADVYITATFKANGMPFVDVHRTQWFYDSIYYVWSNDMMEGDSATTFNPDGTMTRAMFWAVLGRMDGQTITGTNWVEQARNWAMREGVSDGTNPNDYVTREQMVTMLWRYAGEKNGSANLNRYTDSGSVSGYAVEAMRWAIGNGVIQGVTSTTLAPKANATRAECATIFMRFDKM